MQFNETNDRHCPESYRTDATCDTVHTRRRRHHRWSQGDTFPLSDELTKEFYDTLFGHGPTSGVFVDGERPDREKTFQEWWERTVSTPIDEAYFGWMALVGLAHVVRNVDNPMMLSMASFIVGFVGGQVAEMDDVDDDEANRLVEAFSRPSSRSVRSSRTAMTMPCRKPSTTWPVCRPHC